MSRRPLAIDDSLDLLLDAMTNAFGGVIFIGLVVVLLSRQQRVETQPNQDNRETIGVHELEMSLMRRRQELAAAKLGQGQVLELMDKYGKHPNLSKVDEYHKLIAKLAEASKGTKTARMKAVKDSKDAEDMAEKATAKRCEQEKAQEALVALEDETVQLRAELAGKHETLKDLEKLTRKAEINFARLKSESRVPFWIMVSAGQFYCVNKNGTALSNADDFSGDVVCAQPQDDSFVVSPIPGQGVSLETVMRESFLQCAPRARFYLDFNVQMDSFDTWAKLKPWLQEHGYSFNWSPLGSGEKLYLFRTTNTSRESY